MGLPARRTLRRTARRGLWPLRPADLRRGLGLLRPWRFPRRRPSRSPEPTRLWRVPLPCAIPSRSGRQGPSRPAAQPTGNAATRLGIGKSQRKGAQTRPHATRHRFRRGRDVQNGGLSATTRTFARAQSPHTCAEPMGAVHRCLARSYFRPRQQSVRGACAWRCLGWLAATQGQSARRAPRAPRRAPLSMLIHLAGARCASLLETWQLGQRMSRRQAA